MRPPYLMTEERIEQIDSLNLKVAQEPFKALQISEQEIADCYRRARECFTNKEFETARQAFLFLSTLCPQHAEMWLGLGMSLQQLGHYEEAIDAYELAALVDPSSPVAYFYLSKCFFAMHEYQHVLNAIELALECSEGREEFSSLYLEAMEVKALILKRLS